MRRYAAGIIHLDAFGEVLPVLPPLTGNPPQSPQGFYMPELTTEVALNILIGWLQDNIIATADYLRQRRRQH
jgi:hypothetical protein